MSLRYSLVQVRVLVVSVLLLLSCICLSGQKLHVNAEKASFDFVDS